VLRIEVGSHRLARFESLVMRGSLAERKEREPPGGFVFSGMVGPVILKCVPVTDAPPIDIVTVTEPVGLGF
jgi:hypothetical protein